MSSDHGRLAPRGEVGDGGGFEVLVERDAIREHVIKTAHVLRDMFGDAPFVLANLGEEGVYFKTDLLKVLGPLGAVVTSASLDIRNVGHGAGAHLIRPVGGSLSVSRQHLVLAQGRTITGGTARFATNYALASRGDAPGAESVTVVSLIGAGGSPDVAGIEVGETPIAGYGIAPLPSEQTADPGLTRYAYYPEIYHHGPV